MRAIQPDAGYYNDVSMKCYTGLIQLFSLGI